MPTRLPLDLQFAIVALAERFSACHRISLRDLNDELPARALTREEVGGLLSRLADHGLDVIDDAAGEELFSLVPCRSVD